MTKETRIYNGEKTVSSINGARKTGQLHVKRNEIRTPSNTIHKNKVKMNQRPKCNARQYKTLRGKHRTLFDINHSNIFYDVPSRLMKIKPKINKWDLVKLKSLCTANQTINKKKRQQNGRKYLQVM